MTTSETGSRWPWGIALALAVFASGLGVLIVMAVRSNSDLVVEDYYEQELRYDEHMGQAVRADSLAGDVEVNYDGKLGAVILRFPEGHAVEGLKGELHFYRPSAALMDRKVALNLNTVGMQVIPVRDFAPGLWRVKVQWTAAGEGYFVERRLELPAGGA
jgi:nitrogen fixation protein FixH